MSEKLSSTQQNKNNQGIVQARDSSVASVSRTEKLAYINNWEREHNYFFEKDYKYNLLVNQPKDSLIAKLAEIERYQSNGGKIIIWEN